MVFLLNKFFPEAVDKIMKAQLFTLY